MDLIQPDTPGPGRVRPLRQQGVVVDMAARARGERSSEDELLRCVSSGYMSGGCSCPRTIPRSVAAAAWAAECSLADGDRLFHFPWQGQVWLGFGLAGGEVRGVYCPSHRAGRDARSSGCEAQHYAPATAVSA
jgi:hypothetical protein